MVPVEQHPLGRGRKGKKYNVYDRVEPLIDCISDLHKDVSRLRGWAVVARGLRNCATDRVDTETVPRDHTGPPVLCVACGTTDPSKLKVDGESFLVCECGTVNGRSGFGNDYAEARDPQKRRAEPCAPSVPGGRMRASSVVPEAEQRRCGMGAAVHICGRSTAVSESSLPPKIESKLQSAVEHINRLASRMSPIDQEVVAEIRRTAGRVVQLSHEHSRHCCKANCTLTICDKPPQVIAAKCFIFCVEKLCSGEGVSGVSKQTLASLHQRVRTEHVFSLRDNNVQHESCAAAIATIDAEDFVLTRPCAHVKHGKRERDDESKKVSLKRVSSGGLDGVVRASKLTCLRNAIADSDFGFEPGVGAAAIRLLTCNGLAAAIKSGTAIPHGLGDSAAAYLLMRAVAQREGGACSASPPTCVDLADIDVDGVVAAVCALLPEESAEEDDEMLF
tara:strand:+ start:3566 stop:4906 length:1341 start_codon:yes stop_codon:yes gene_type:complete